MKFSDLYVFKITIFYTISLNYIYWSSEGYKALVNLSAYTSPLIMTIKFIYY